MDNTRPRHWWTEKEHNKFLELLIEEYLFRHFTPEYRERSESFVRIMIASYLYRYGQGSLESFKKFIMNSSLTCFFNLKDRNQLLQCTWHKQIMFLQDMPVIADPETLMKAYEVDEQTSSSLRERLKKINKKQIEKIEKIIQQEGAESILCLGKRKGTCDNNEIYKKQNKKNGKNV